MGWGGGGGLGLFTSHRIAMVSLQVMTQNNWQNVVSARLFLLVAPSLLFAPFKKAQQASRCFISLFYSIFILIILNIYVFISINLSSLFWELYICCYMSLNFRSTYTYPEWHDQNCFSYIILLTLFFLCYLSFIILLFKNLTCDIMYNL